MPFKKRLQGNKVLYSDSAGKSNSLHAESESVEYDFHDSVESSPWNWIPWNKTQWNQTPCGKSDSLEFDSVESDAVESDSMKSDSMGSDIE